MKTSSEQLRTWLGRVRRIVRTSMGKDDSPRWAPEVVRVEQMEFEFPQQRSLRAAR
jgi:hypothetical protein